LAAKIDKKIDLRTGRKENPNNKLSGRGKRWDKRTLSLS